MTRKEYDRAKHSHPRDGIGRDGQGTERIRPSEGHLPPGDDIGRDRSGYGKNPTEREALTNWRPNRGGQVKTWKESDRVRGTHTLETASGGTSQESGHEKNPTERGALTL